MSEFFKLVYQLMANIFRNIGTCIATIALALWHCLVTAWGEYAEIVMEYSEGFNVIQWIFTILFCLLVISVPVCIIGYIVYRIKYRITLRKSQADRYDMMKEINSLNQQVNDLINEKNKLMAMKIHQMGILKPENETEIDTEVKEGDKTETTEAGSRDINLTGQDGALKVQFVETSDEELMPIRFPKLHSVDERYAAYVRPEFDNDISLADFIERYRMYAASRLKLYYDASTIRLFVAGMATSKILILEGISGTGKTSLPYSFSKYMNNPSTLISVQPSYRERTELIGYFNEFSKRFNETEFLRAVYEAGYREDPTLIVLDEMNLARIEYYFAEMLSVLEMPSPEEWLVDLVSTQWNSDPSLLRDGKLHVATSIWFVGTANNDDSTFTITDKVYDRAMPIELNKRADPFEAPDTDPVYITCDHLNEMFEKAFVENAITEKTMANIEKLDSYISTRFKLTFGNRIMKQLKAFVPVYVACGGNELEGLDYFVARKILKKFESMNVAFVRDEIKEFITFIDKTFGRQNMKECKAYLTRIQNMF